jgi:hypothetical protein
MTTQENLAEDLKKRFGGIADRITLYTPFVPGEKDAVVEESGEGVQLIPLTNLR